MGEVSSTNEAKRSNALALEIIQKNLSKAMRDKMKTITSTKELLLSLEQIYKEDDEEDEEKLMEMLLEAKAENKMRQSQQLESEEPSNAGKYTGNISKPPVDFIEKDCSKVEMCFHCHYNSESDKSNNLSYLDDRVNMYIESESE